MCICKWLECGCCCYDVDIDPGWNVVNSRRAVLEVLLVEVYHSVDYLQHYHGLRLVQGNA